MVAVISPEGKAVDVPEQGVDALLALGWTRNDESVDTPAPKRRVATTKD